jgi:tetratricopeptide (TPR) repeat protein
MENAKMIYLTSNTVRSGSFSWMLLSLISFVSYGQYRIPQAHSLSGKPLFSEIVDVKTTEKCDSIIYVIQSKENLSEDDFVEIGKQLVTKARYREAAANFSEGLVYFPNSFRLLRYRGHHYLTLRKLDYSADDLLKAKELIKGQPDCWEVDAKGKRTDTYRHQIEYDLGVNYFLRRNYQEAVTAFETSLKEAHEPNEIVKTTDWLYNAYMRNGQLNEAEKLLTTITPDFKSDHKQPYFLAIMLYKGLSKPNDFVDENESPDQWNVQQVIRAYGVANWYFFQGDTARAKELYNQIIQSSKWTAFRYLAAEAELMN